MISVLTGIYLVSRLCTRKLADLDPKLLVRWNVGEVSVSWPSGLNQYHGCMVVGCSKVNN